MEPQLLPKGFYDAASRQPQRQGANGLGQDRRPKGGGVKPNQQAQQFELTDEQLPATAANWSSHELGLWRSTAGQFDPSQKRGTERRIHASPPCDLVSVIAVTSGCRQHYHELLWAVFSAQTWLQKELVVVETYKDKPSPYFAARAPFMDDLVHIALEERPGITVGLKRNIGVHVARGQYILHFDDDDLYAPNYISMMMRALTELEARAIKLASWWLADLTRGIFGLCDPVEAGKAEGMDESDPIVRAALYGFGFSLAYRRAIFSEVQFAELDSGEDNDFLERCLEINGANSVAAIDDPSGLCLHVYHGQNATDARCCLVQQLPADEAWARIGELDVAACPGLNMYLWIVDFLRKLAMQEEGAEIEPAVSPELVLLVSSFGGTVGKAVFTMEDIQRASTAVALHYHADGSEVRSRGALDGILAASLIAGCGWGSHDEKISPDGLAIDSVKALRQGFFG